MKYSALLRLKVSSASGKLAKLLLISLGLNSGVFAAYVEPREAVLLWREWMSILQREPSQASKPRIYVTTKREILQTSFEKAQFQNGMYSFMLADGTVPDVDGDVDYYTDVFEDVSGSNRNDPFSIPRDNTGTPLPRDAFPVVLADGSLMGIANSVSFDNIAVTVSPFSGDRVRVIASPSSDFVRPASFRDFSTQFTYIEPGTGYTKVFPLSLYYMNKNYPNPANASAMESTLVAGKYDVEFPTLQNSPYGKSGTSVVHRLVPNGSLTKGLKKPTWLLRSLTSIENSGSPPVAQSWVNGRLKFDPYLPVNLTWDNLNTTGFATQGDLIDISVENANGITISDRFRMSAYETMLSFSMNSKIRLVYGSIRGNLGNPPLSLNGSIVMKFSRLANGLSSADLSTVTVRVPVQMAVSYASWRNEMFPLDYANNSISGPGADPDRDGITNQQEFALGSDPTVAIIATVDPTVENITLTSATLGATVESDPYSAVNVDIYERGVVYSVSSINPFPTIDGPGVLRMVSAPPEVGSFTVGVTSLTANTQYSFQAYVLTSLGTFYSTPVSTFKTLLSPPVTLPTVTSPTSSGLTANLAVLGGNVTSDGGSAIINRGVVYSVTATNDNPFIGGAGVTQLVGVGTTGVFTVNAAGLLPATTYSFRAYATNAVGTSHTTTLGSFTTLPTTTAPTLTSPTSTNITTVSASLGGNVTSTGGASVLQRGVVFSSTNTNPEMGGAGVTAFAATTTGLGVFTVNASVLMASTRYYFKAYALNTAGIGYSAVGNFTTLGSLATITDPTLADLTSTSATLGANVTSTGSGTITERGFIYSATATNSNPIIGGPGVTQIPVAGELGVYSANITGLTANKGYTFKPYAINSLGTAYGAPWVFFTTFQTLGVSDPTAANITATTATLGGTVASGGGTTISERGVVYTTDSITAPELGGAGVIAIIASGSVGPFTVDASGLDSDATYYFRAYATDGGGTSYSSVANFKTLAVQLLGQSQIEWVTVEAAISSFQPDGDPPAIQEASPSTPRFVYLKDPSEALDPLTYQIEVSVDFGDWQPIDESDWRVETTTESLTATWDSASKPPSRIFFRVTAR